MEYLERCKRHIETVREQKRRQMLNTQDDRPLGTTQNVGADDLNSVAGHSQISFNPKTLAQPTTIPYEKIQRAIIKLQTQFRKSHSERGSYLEDGYEPTSRQMGSTGTAAFHKDS